MNRKAILKFLDGTESGVRQIAAPKREDQNPFPGIVTMNVGGRIGLRAFYCTGTRERGTVGYYEECEHATVS